MNVSGLSFKVILALSVVFLAVSDSAQAKTYKVKKGDALYKVAQKHGVSSKAIISANGLQSPYDLLIGQKLKIPTATRHKVKKGETLYKISRKYGVDMALVAKKNKLKKPYNLLVGQKLSIPYKGASVSVSKSSKKSKTPFKRGKSYTKAKKSSGAKTKSSKRENFYWPVKGKIVSSFGAKRGGIYNDGINIAAPEGRNVRAAASGTVVYTGSELKGYGNLVIIKHSNGWITAYAHTKDVKVEKGQRVKRGQVIGEVGVSGNVSKPQLHFAIRKGRTAHNPIKLLKG